MPAGNLVELCCKGSDHNMCPALFGAGVRFLLAFTWYGMLLRLWLSSAFVRSEVNDGMGSPVGRSMIPVPSAGSLLVGGAVGVGARGAGKFSLLRRTVTATCGPSKEEPTAAPPQALRVRNGFCKATHSERMCGGTGPAGSGREDLLGTIAMDPGDQVEEAHGHRRIGLPSQHRKYLWQRFGTE